MAIEYERYRMGKLFGRRIWSGLNVLCLNTSDISRYSDNYTCVSSIGDAVGLCVYYQDPLSPQSGQHYYRPTQYIVACCFVYVRLLHWKLIHALSRFTLSRTCPYSVYLRL